MAESGERGQRTADSRQQTADSGRQKGQCGEPTVPFVRSAVCCLPGGPCGAVRGRSAGRFIHKKTPREGGVLHAQSVHAGVLAAGSMLRLR